MGDRYLKEIKVVLPDSQISEVKPCTTEGRYQIHMRIRATDVGTLRRIIDVKKFCEVMEKSQIFQNVRCSEELGLAKSSTKEMEISVLASGRIVIKKAKDNEKAHAILLEIAHLLKDSKSFLPLVNKKST